MHNNCLFSKYLLKNQCVNVLQSLIVPHSINHNRSSIVSLSYRLFSFKLSTLFLNSCILLFISIPPKKNNNHYNHFTRAYYTILSYTLSTKKIEKNYFFLFFPPGAGSSLYTLLYIYVLFSSTYSKSSVLAVLSEVCQLDTPAKLTVST